MKPIKTQDEQLKILRDLGLVGALLSTTALSACDPRDQAAGNEGASAATQDAVWAAALNGGPIDCLSGTASLVGFSNTAVELSGNADVRGSVVLLGDSTLSLHGNAVIKENAYVKAASQVVMTGNARVQQVVQQDFTAAEQAVMNFDQKLSERAATMSRGPILESVTFEGNGDVNVIEVNGDILLSGQDRIRLKGSQADLFLFNVKGDVAFSGNAGMNLDGVQPRNVMFRLAHADSQITVTGQGNLYGTFFAPRGSARLAGNGKINGSVFAWNSLRISGNGLSIDPAPFCPAKWAPPAPTPEPSAEPSASPSAVPTDEAGSGTDAGTGTDSGSGAGDGSTDGALPEASPSPSATPCTGLSCGAGGVLGV